jgi:hypothetical protein
VQHALVIESAHQDHERLVDRGGLDRVAHRFHPRLPHDENLRVAKDLVKCDRQLFEKMKALKGDELADKTKNYLNKSEVNGVMARRDKIVATFQALIAQKGEKEVLY